MRVGIMQPYFLPYIGYWQLMNAVDKYVIYDDVNFIKGGWINRNRILINGEVKYFNIPMMGASSNKLINEIGVNNDANLINKNLRTIENAYSKAPFFENVYPIIERILRCGKRNIAEYIIESFSDICRYLGITTELIVSSSLKKDSNLKGQDKVLEICRLLDASDYYNAIGGMKLYNPEKFATKGINLHFLRTGSIAYRQFENEFKDNLSIIDVMMFNSKSVIQEMLKNFELV